MVQGRPRALSLIRHIISSKMATDPRCITALMDFSDLYKREDTCQRLPARAWLLSGHLSFSFHISFFLLSFLCGSLHHDFLQAFFVTRACNRLHGRSNQRCETIFFVSLHKTAVQVEFLKRNANTPGLSLHHHQHVWRWLPTRRGLITAL
jgi:hypothetical protein